MLRAFLTTWENASFNNEKRRRRFPQNARRATWFLISTFFFFFLRPILLILRGPQAKKHKLRALSFGMDFFLIHKKFLVDSWCKLLKIDVWKSRKHGRERCRFVSGNLCLWRHEQGRANLFLFLIWKRRSNIAAPRRAQVRKKKKEKSTSVT